MIGVIPRAKQGNEPGDILKSWHDLYFTHLDSFLHLVVLQELEQN